jgi:ABC-type sugar transport system ATPase subunit
LSREARVIVMDETSATPAESECRILFRTIVGLKQAGIGIIYISRHFEEGFEICDRVTVMRDGSTVETRPTAAWTQESLVQAMANRPIAAFFPKREVASCRPSDSTAPNSSRRSGSSSTPSPRW